MVDGPASSDVVVVVSGGASLTETERAALPAGAFVIAADSGLDRAFEIGLAVDVAVGDFDSATAAGYTKAERDGSEIVRHPASKDETDLELALIRAVEEDPQRIVVVSLGGGRLDHQLASVLVLADRRFSAVEIDGYAGDTRVSVIHDRRTLTGRVGDLVTLLPVGGDAVGVSTSGLRYPLRGETLKANSPRGVSNEFSAAMAVVELSGGALLAIQPGRP